MAGVSSQAGVLGGVALLKKPLRPRLRGDDGADFIASISARIGVNRIGKRVYPSSGTSSPIDPYGRIAPFCP